jgi:hypothetical protein
MATWSELHLLHKRPNIEIQSGYAMIDMRFVNHDRCRLFTFLNSLISIIDLYHRVTMWNIILYAFVTVRPIFMVEITSHW